MIFMKIYPHFPNAVLRGALVNLSMADFFLTALIFVTFAELMLLEDIEHFFLVLHGKNKKLFFGFPGGADKSKDGKNLEKGETADS